MCGLYGACLLLFTVLSGILMVVIRYISAILVVILTVLVVLGSLGMFAKSLCAHSRIHVSFHAIAPYYSYLG